MMKRKLLSIFLAAFLVFGLTACDEIQDMINKVQTGASFYQDFQKYEPIFTEANELIISTDTTIVVNDTDLAVTPENITSTVYLMIDKENDLTYADVLMNDLEQTAVYEQDSNIVYLIEESVVTPFNLSENEELYDLSNENGNILNESFDPLSVTDEELVDGVYKFSIDLNQAIDLDELSEFVTVITPSGDVPSLENAIANVEIKFQETVIDEETKYDIDVLVTLEDYRIEFEDESFIDITVTNHSTLTVPVEFNFPEIFTSAYQFVAVDNADLALRAYLADEAIVFPVVANENGYIKLSLTAGHYRLSSMYLDQLSYQVFDSEMNEVVVLNGAFEVSDGDYYLYILPTGSFLADIQVVEVS